MYVMSKPCCIVSFLPGSLSLETSVKIKFLLERRIGKSRLLGRLSNPGAATKCDLGFLSVTEMNGFLQSLLKGGRR